MRISTQDIEVQKEDQIKINTFSRLNMLYHERQKNANEVKELISALKDGLDEMELMDDSDKIAYKFGDCFFQIPVSQARQLNEGQIEQLQKSIKDLGKELDDIKKQMGNLKAKLYAKFGNNINLEEE